MSRMNQTSGENHTLNNSSWIDISNQEQMNWIQQYCNKKRIRAPALFGTSSDQIATHLPPMLRQKMESAWRSYKSRQENKDKAVITISLRTLKRAKSEAKRLKLTTQEYLDIAVGQEINKRIKRQRCIGSRPYVLKKNALNKSISDLEHLFHNNPSPDEPLIQAIQKQIKEIREKFDSLKYGINWNNIKSEQ
jgi:hypothetical protein